MDWLVRRVCDGGRPLPRHCGAGRQLRGRVILEEQFDKERRRTLLCARLIVAGQYAERVPDLCDVRILPSTGDVYVLTGWERIQAGPLAHEYTVGQTWLLEAGPDEDLRRAENRWTDASREADQLRRHIAALIAKLQTLGIPPRPGATARGIGRHAPHSDTASGSAQWRSGGAHARSAGRRKASAPSPPSATTRTVRIRQVRSGLALRGRFPSAAAALSPQQPKIKRPRARTGAHDAHSKGTGRPQAKGRYAIRSA